MRGRYFFSSILLIVLLSLVSAVDQQALPTWQDKYVNDYADVLDSSQNAGIRDAFVNVEQETTAELTFISVSECAPYAPGDLATTLFNQWKVGKADKDNGLLILYCLEEKKIFAATGYGLEGILPDSKVGRLLDEYYVSWRDVGNASEGIVQFSYAVSEVIMENKDEVLSGQAGAKTNYLYVFIIVGIIVLFAIYFVNMRRNMKKKKKEKYGWVRVVLGVLLFIIGAQVLPLVIGWILLVIGFILLNVGRGAGGAYVGSGFGGSSGGGFSGGGFGGGFSGGGGAGR